MRRATGTGGAFIKAHNPGALRAWHRVQLGLDVPDRGGRAFRRHEPGRPNEHGSTVRSVVPHSGDRIAPSRAPCMVNYRVADLHALLAALRREGRDVDDEMLESEYGKFGWVMDPEGNCPRLWEPPSGPLP